MDVFKERGADNSQRRPSRVQQRSQAAYRQGVLEGHLLQHGPESKASGAEAEKQRLLKDCQRKRPEDSAQKQVEHSRPRAWT